MRSTVGMWMLSLILASPVAFANEIPVAPDNLMLIQSFSNAPPVIVKNWAELPQEFAQKSRLPEGTALGLWLFCDKSFQPDCDANRVILVPLVDIVDIKRDKNRANVNVFNRPEHTAWVLKDKAGYKYRNEIPPRLLIYTGAPSRVSFDHYGYQLSTGNKGLRNGVGIVPELPVIELDLNNGSTKLQLIPLSTLQSVRQVSMAEAQAEVNAYREAERAKAAEQVRMAAEQARMVAQQAIFEEKERLAAAARQRETEARNISFRKTMKAGDESHCGLIVEVKKPIVQVQTMIGPMWLKINQLYVPGDKRCTFSNGVYQD